MPWSDTNIVLFARVVELGKSPVNETKLPQFMIYHHIMRLHITVHYPLGVAVIQRLLIIFSKKYKTVILISFKKKRYIQNFSLQLPHVCAFWNKYGHWCLHTGCSHTLRVFLRNVQILLTKRQPQIFQACKCIGLLKDTLTMSGDNCKHSKTSDTIKRLVPWEVHRCSNGCHNQSELGKES